MSPTLITADLGNTRVKLCAWSAPGALRGGEPSATTTFAADAGAGEAAQRFLAELPAPPAGVALCAVGDPLLEDEVAEVLAAARSSPRVLRGSGHGLALDCEHPETIGEDRLFAARGALELLGRTALVIDAGTAVTVDLLRVEGGRGTFAGGAIAPGPELLAAALAGGGARLPAIDPAPGVPALGQHTRAALEAGVAVGFRGAVRELARGIAREAGLVRPPIALTGGARAFLTGVAGPLDGDLTEDPWLVHRGLLAALEDARRP